MSVPFLLHSGLAFGIDLRMLLLLVVLHALVTLAAVLFANYIARHILEPGYKTLMRSRRGVVFIPNNLIAAEDIQDHDIQSILAKIGDSATL